jgi:hypothetical protein
MLELTNPAHNCTLPHIAAEFFVVDRWSVVEGEEIIMWPATSQYMGPVRRRPRGQCCRRWTVFACTDRFDSAIRS